MVNRGRRAVLIASLALATISATFGSRPHRRPPLPTPGTKSLGGPGTQSIESIAAVDGGFLAVGNEVISGDSAPVVWRGSANGHTWKRSTRPAMPIPTGDPLETTIAAVASSDSVVVAVGQAEDNPAVHPPGGYPTAPVFWHATGDGGLVLGASDPAGDAAQVPTNWDFGQFRPTSVASGDGRFVAGGSVAPPSGNPACDASAHMAVDRRRQFVARLGRAVPAGRCGHAWRPSPTTRRPVSSRWARRTPTSAAVQSTAALWGSSDGAKLAAVQRCRQAPTRSASPRPTISWW